MIDLGRSESGVFASRSITGHLVRGAIAASLLMWAVLHQQSHPALAIIALLLAVVAMRGCPACWTVGLVETVGQKLTGRRSSCSGPACRR